MKEIKLENIKDRKLPYEAPADYFDQLESKIHRRIHAQPEQPYHAPRLLLQWAATGLCVIMVAMSVWLLHYKTSTLPNKAMASIEDVPVDEILSYLESTEISTKEIASLSPDAARLLDINESLENIDLNAIDVNDLYVPFGIEENI